MNCVLAAKSWALTKLGNLRESLRTNNRIPATLIETYQSVGNGGQLIRFIPLSAVTEHAIEGDTATER